jgi:hypothetical protein
MGQLLHEPPQLFFFWSDPQHSFQGSVNPEQLYKVEVFQGVFLDARLAVDSTSQFCSLTFFPQCLSYIWGFLGIRHHGIRLGSRI